jgi:hypothetical protein
MMCEPWEKLALSIIARKDEARLPLLRDCFVAQHVSSEEIKEVLSWIEEFKKEVMYTIESLSAKGVLLPKELRSFIEDPIRHLSKKLFIYSHDLLRGKYDLREFEKKCVAAIRTSLRTNMRSVYESWVFLAIIGEIAQRNNVDMIYPEHRYILIERTGRQRGGNIPPNLIIHLHGKGLVSFFLEAPRPISWEDSRDLNRAWKLYVALRPDIMVYSGLTTDIVELSANPPIKQPDVIIEVKELEDWFVRSREIRGPFARSISAEEWRDRWIRGLWSGLADVLGVSSPEAAYEKAKERKGIRLNETQIVVLYAKVYRPKRLYLISRKKVPVDIRNELENNDVYVVDDVNFERDKLREVAEYLEDIASYKSTSYVPVYIDVRKFKSLHEIAMLLGFDTSKTLEALIDFAWTHREMLQKEVRSKYMDEDN